MKKLLQMTSHTLLWLVFSFLFIACRQNKKVLGKIDLHWEENKARAISIPKELLEEISSDSIRLLLKVQLENTDAHMLGDFSSTNDAVLFQPLIPFTSGLKYEVFLSNKLIGSILIPRKKNAERPQIIGLYPSGAVVPENLLKLYLVFSKPMQEGQAIENIAMVRNNKDTVSVFLDLQHELWNKERTILTLWLDPGRIKRGLQPNEKSGIPLRQGDSCKLLINGGWRDIEGLPLNVHVRFFNVGSRDSISPSIDRWEISSPAASKKEPLKIKFNEQLDYLLLKNTLSIKDSRGTNIAGLIEVEEEETVLVFTPATAWTPGRYTLEVEARLEDLAGNNLNRLFDKDITRGSTVVQKQLHTRVFQVH